MSFEFVARHRVASTQDWLFEIDEYRRDKDQFLLAHLRVFRWSVASLKSMRHHWRLFRSVVTAPLFAVGEVDDDKWRRFITLFGFAPLMTVVCENCETRSMYINKQASVSATPKVPNGHVVDPTNTTDTE